MTFPPPPHDSSSPHGAGGFGPPQGFGPPPAFGPPGGSPTAQPVAGAPGGFAPVPGGYGSPPPLGVNGFPPPGGGFPPGPPGGDGGGRGPKVAAITLAVVLVAGLGVGGLLISRDGDGDTKTDAAPRTSSSARPTDSATPPGRDPAAGDAAPGDVSGSPSPTAPVAIPFVALRTGVCFDHPALDPKVEQVVERACGTKHDGEVIGNKTLTGDFASEDEVQAEALRLCEKAVTQRMRKIPRDDRQYYNYALYPSLSTYEVREENRVSCALTLSNGPGGRKLSAPLPG